MNHNDTSWVCYARPVTLYGRRCGHVNTSAMCTCSACGCTWQASEDRRWAAEAAEAPRRAQRHREAAAHRKRIQHARWQAHDGQGADPCPPQ